MKFITKIMRSSKKHYGCTPLNCLILIIWKQNYPETCLLVRGSQTFWVESVDGQTNILKS